jgi:hypothetical protein
MGTHGLCSECVPSGFPLKFFEPQQISMTGIERVRLALAMADAGYEWEVEIEYVEELLTAYDALKFPPAASKNMNAGGGAEPDIEARIGILSDALKSISKNTCCDNCQEAARVARSALGAYVGLAREAHSPAASPPISPQEAASDRVREALERLTKMTDCHIVDDTPVDAYGRFDLTYGDLRTARAALSSAPAAAGEREDARRYRRLRLLGCAPCYTEYLRRGEVLRFTNLDAYLDEDIKTVPSRGEATESPTLSSPASSLEREELVDAIAKWLHDETAHPDSYPDHTWPETERDDGRREGGWVKIVPQHAQAYFRDIARRLLAVFPSALSSPLERSPRGGALSPAATEKPVEAEVDGNDIWEAYMRDTPDRQFRTPQGAIAYALNYLYGRFHITLRRQG